MTDKELKKLSRSELLEILLEVMRENEDLRQELDECRKQNKEKDIAISTSGTLSEAALKLSGIFEAADKAVSIYLENIKKNAAAFSQPVQPPFDQTDNHAFDGYIGMDEDLTGDRRLEFSPNSEYDSFDIPSPFDGDATRVYTPFDNVTIEKLMVSPEDFVLSPIRRKDDPENII